MMVGEKLVAISRRLYNQSIDISSLTADLYRQGSAIKRNAAACGYAAVMGEYRILLGKVDQIHDILAKASAEGKIDASEVNKVRVGLSDYQREVFEDMTTALKEKCGCK